MSSLMARAAPVLSEGRMCRQHSSSCTACRVLGTHHKAGTLLSSVPHCLTQQPFNQPGKLRPRESTGPMCGQKGGSPRSGFESGSLLLQNLSSECPCFLSEDNGGRGPLTSHTSYSTEQDLPLHPPRPLCPSEGSLMAYLFDQSLGGGTDLLAQCFLLWGTQWPAGATSLPVCTRWEVQLSKCSRNLSP